MIGGDLYLDHAATTPPRPEAVKVMLALLGEDLGNPSSQHSRGRRARLALDEARERLATALSCAPGEIVLTATATEANNLALRGALESQGAAGRHLVTTAVEHDSVLATARALEESGRAEVTVVGCDGGGVVDAEAVAAAVRPDTALVSMILAGNELGTVQEVAASARLARERNPSVLVHTDAVQALGRLPVHPGELGVDLLTATAHKVYGPRGAALLHVRAGVRLAAQCTGGGQERGRRSGTENVAAAAAFAAAVELADRERGGEMARQRELAERLVDLIVAAIPDAIVPGDPRRRLPGFAPFVFPEVRGELLVTALDRAGVCASAGSACASGAVQASHVLAALGLEEERAGGFLRCTVGRGTTPLDIERAAGAIAGAVSRLRGTAPRRQAPASPQPV